MISCFIVNGINLARHPDGTCTVLATVAKEDPNRPNTFGVRFAVKDDGDGLNSTPSSGSQTWMASDQQRMSPISLHLFKKIVDAHGGSIGVDSKPGKGSCFYFEIHYPLPMEAEPVVEVLNKSKLRKLSAADQAAQLAKTQIPLVPSSEKLAQLSAVQSLRAQTHLAVEKVERKPSPVRSPRNDKPQASLPNKTVERSKPSDGSQPHFSGFIDNFY